MIVKKGTLLIPSGPPQDPNRRHLFIVATDADATGNHILVPVSSWSDARSCDPTCRLEAHDHPFLTHPSFVLYRKAREEAVETLNRGVARRIFTPQAPVNAQIFLRVWNGFCRSPQTPLYIQRAVGCAPLDRKARSAAP